MSKSLFLTSLACVALGVPAVADTLNVQLFPLTGEIRLYNPSLSAVPFVYYSITSSTNHAGALNPNNPQWHSISDYYDVSGNGFIDPTHDWTKIKATSTELTEGVFVGTGSLAANRAITLGQAWNPAVVPYTDLAFDIRQDGWPAIPPITVNVQTAVAGDYDHNGTVNNADYTIWRMTIGSTTSLDADGNLDGVVNAADYAIWRKYFGSTLPGAGSSVSGGQSLGLVASGVPEPSSAALIGLAVSAVLFPARRRAA